MKFKDLVIGSIVIDYNKEKICSSRFPYVGKVVDITFQYDMDILCGAVNRGEDMNKIQVCPVVHFIGEGAPREVNIDNIEIFEGHY